MQNRHMAAEIQPQPQARKPCLLSKIEAFQEVVSTAMIIPKEDGVISLSEDRYSLKIPIVSSDFNRPLNDWGVCKACQVSV